MYCGNDDSVNMINGKINKDRLRKFTDLYVCQYGMENCSPGHCFGPHVRNHFLIHYILKGKGTYHNGGKTYHLSEGNGFLICPDVVTVYKADMSEPWTYTWIGFNGLAAASFLKQAGLDNENPIFLYNKDDMMKNCFYEMVNINAMSPGSETRLLSLLYLFLSLLIENCEINYYLNDNESKKQLYFRKALEYMEMNYSRKITIDETANYIGIGRTYLFQLFKKYMNISPQEYLLNLRIDKACELMSNNILTIGDISRSVGYEDPLLFSKMFKKVKGMSPRDYRMYLGYTNE